MCILLHIPIAKLYKAMYGYDITWAKRLQAFEQLHFVRQHERQLIMYSLDICVIYSIYLAIFYDP